MATFNPIVVALSYRGCSQATLAKELGVSRATVAVWKRRGFIPPKNVKRVAELTGIPAHVLCPTYFPAPPVAQGVA